jgi:TfoX/Sxy family transcriptional regulator of competence genes
MAYDEGLAERIRGVLEDRKDVSEKRMFGGIAFLVKGHMSVGIVKDELMVRVGPAAYDRLLEQPHARKMDFTGRPMKGFLYVSSAGLESDGELASWIEQGVAFASALPAREPRPGTGSAALPSRRGAARRDEARHLPPAGGRARNVRARRGR